MNGNRWILALLSIGLVVLAWLVLRDNYRLNVFPFTELAMTPGMEIAATNENGTVRIYARSDLVREYWIDGSHYVRELRPREERFMGQLGAYDPASQFVLNPRLRIVAVDSVLSFESQDEIAAALYSGSRVFDWVYTDDGLVVGYSHTADRNQVNVYVFQYLLNGEKPKSLPGSEPNKIFVTYRD